MKKIKFTGWPYYSEEEANKVKKVLLSNKVNYWTGTEGREFEREFALFAGSKYAVAVSSCTAGLHLALMCLPKDKKNKVITSPISFVSTANTILLNNFKPPL